MTTDSAGSDVMIGVNLPCIFLFIAGNPCDQQGYQNEKRENKNFFGLFRNPKGSFCPRKQAIDQDEAADDDSRGH
jgi:hypothetical protein